MPASTTLFRAQPAKPGGRLREPILIVALFSAAVLSFAAIVWFNLNHIEAAVARDEQAHAVLTESDAVQSALLGEETGVRGYILSAKTDFLKEYGGEGQMLNRALAHLTEMTASNPHQRALVAEIANTAAIWRQSVAEPEIAKVREGRSGVADAMTGSGMGLGQMTAIRRALDELRASELTIFRERSMARAGAFAVARWMLVIVGLGGSAVAAALGGAALVQLSRSRTEAQTNAAFLGALVEGMPLMLAVKNADDLRYELLNRTGETLMGVSRDRVLGKTPFDLLPKAMAEHLVAVDRKTLDGGNALNVEEVTLQTPVGARDLSVHKIPFTAPDGTRHLIAISSDITHLKAVAKALEAALEDAQSAARAKTAFLANMSHEIRTPLNGVLGIAEALARSDGLKPEHVQLVDTIRSSATQVDRLLEDLMRLTRGDVGVERRAFNLAQLVSSAALAVSGEAAVRGLELSTEVAPGADAGFVGDADGIGRILSVLMDNAVKFTEAGSVRLSAQDLGDMRFRLQVRDTGIGFEAEERSEVFETFSQLDGSASRPRGGAGLGLAIARKAAQAMGAELSAESKAGGGATFTLDVELEACDSRQTPPLKDQPSDIADDVERPLRALIVDDHPTNRQVLQLILDQVGVSWLSVENGAKAVEVCGAEPFDIVLMDIQMPIMDGFTATREIRRCEREAGRKPTPIVIVSANCQPEHVREGQDAGAQAHLAKPVVAEALVASMMEALDEAA